MNTVDRDTRCPCCRKLFDQVTNIIRDDGPGPGDFCICIHCVAVLKFGPAMELVFPGPEEEIPGLVDDARNLMLRERLYR